MLSRQRDNIDPNRPQWYLFLGERYQGPYSYTQIKEWLMQGTLGRNALVWCEGMGDWAQPGDTDAFRAYSKDLPAVSDLSFLPPLEGYDDGQENDAFKSWSASSPVTSAPTSKRAEAPNFSSIFDGETRARTAAVAAPLDTRSPATAPNDSVAVAAPAIADSETRIRKAVAFGLCVIIALSAIATVMIQLSSDGVPLPPDLSREERRELQAAIHDPLKTQGPGGAIALSPKEPAFLVGTNLPDGSKLNIHIDGVPETLVGRLKVSVQANVTVKQGIARTPPFRDTNGQAFPRGDYRVTVICTSCPEGAIIAGTLTRLAQKTYFLGGTKDAAYDQALKTYHERLRMQSQAEIAEIKQLAETLASQLDETSTIYRQVLIPLRANARIPRPGKTWTEFHPKWSSLEDQLDITFQRWSQSSLENDYFHGQLYAALKKVGALVRVLHQEQDGVLKETAADVPAETKIESDTQAARSALTDLRERAASIEALPPSANGMPQR